MDLSSKLNDLLKSHKNVKLNFARKELIDEVISRKEALVSKSGALATWSPPESTGRSPKDTYVVRTNENESTIDWDAPNNIPLTPETFQMLIDDSLDTLSKSEAIFTTKRVVGASSDYALPVTTIFKVSYAFIVPAMFIIT